MSTKAKVFILPSREYEDRTVVVPDFSDTASLGVEFALINGLYKPSPWSIFEIFSVNL